MKRKENAITLIALIITVIVMLILAGVAINLTIGENGIFKKSAEGAEIYKNSANDEASNLNEVDEVLGNLIKDIKKQEITNKGTIEYSIAWEQKKASVTLGTTSEYKLQYQVNGEEEGSWQEGTQVNELNLNDIVYARLYDGEVAGNSIKIVIEDVQQPNEVSISFLEDVLAVGKATPVTITQSDNQSGVKIEECKWIFTTQKEVETANYTGTFNSESEEIEIIATEEGMYYLHILTVDNAGNVRKTLKEIKAMVPPGKPDENGVFTENSTINGEEGTAFNPEIPKGFKPVDVDDAIWGSEEGYKKGLVIEDGEGNQFVWIAVDGEVVKLDRYTFESDGTETAFGEEPIVFHKSNGYRTQELASSSYGNTVAKDINGFRTSVAEHGGYYFARYEASNGGDGKPNSKVATPWTSLTQASAATLAKGMYDNNYGATSDLVNSYTWDTTILFIQKYSDAPNYGRQKIKHDTGNTGVSSDVKCNIYDMAGNYYEWSTETNISSFVLSNPKSAGVLRGCCSRVSDGYNYSSQRNFLATNQSDTSAYSFRTILYL